MQCPIRQNTVVFPNYGLLLGKDQEMAAVLARLYISIGSRLYAVRSCMALNGCHFLLRSTGQRGRCSSYSHRARRSLESFIACTGLLSTIQGFLFR